MEEINEVKRNKKGQSLDQVKEYNRKYYAEHKNDIIKKLCQKEACLLCGKKISHNNMKNHQQRSQCKAKQAVTKVVDIQALQTEIDIIVQKLKDLSKKPEI
jgi:hypothetical protein